MNERRVRLALTLGDPGGIGPEIAAALLTEGKLETADILFIGSAAAFMEFLPPSLKVKIEALSPDEAGRFEDYAAGRVIVDTGSGGRPPTGRPSAEGGRTAGLALEVAVSLVREGGLEGIVTGPVSKESLSMAGYTYRGHTEMLSELFRSPHCQMMMVSGELRILILTRDIPLREVPDAVTASGIERGVVVAADALRELWDKKEPRIAVAALNPHGGDGGVLGREEVDVILPAIEGLRERGIAVEGPFPADSLFHGWESKGYDAYVAMYHDQGMIPFKMTGFERGVNVTIGLPVVRTSVCHGTAYDIAGAGRGDTGSLEEAVSLAISCCRMKRGGM